MKKSYTYTKILFSIMLLSAVELAFGAFTTGKTDDTKDKYSLKNLNSASYRVYSLSSLKTNTFRYTGSLDINQQNNGEQLQIKSMIRLERGNTTYVYPYKYTVKVPKFKTPAAPLIH